MNDVPAIDLRDSLAGRFRRSLAYAVGIDMYAHVPPLRTAAGDASAIARVLAGLHGFESRILLNPSAATLHTLLTQDIPEAVTEEDRVLFYYAGHGVALTNDDGPAGYLVPADADPEDHASLLPMAELQRALTALPCRHLLVVLDCCFAGAFEWSAGNRALGNPRPRRLFREHFDFFVNDKARQVITSAAYDQTASDAAASPFADARGTATAEDGALHSPFALSLLRGLKGEADWSGPGGSDGVITATELYVHLREEVEVKSVEAGPGGRQTPGFFPLRGHEKGEFVFLVPGARPELAAAPVESPYRGLRAFEEADSRLFFGRDSVIAELWARAGPPDAANRLIVVIGASGTGKSSVVKAGLIPRLRAAGLDVLVMRPGEAPPAALAEALAQRDGRRFVLVIDQYEELVTRCRTPDDRAAFEAQLAALRDDPALHRIILTVRSDFEPELRADTLRAAWDQGRFLVPAFNLDDLQQAVLEPALQSALVFEPEGLVKTIVDEVAKTPGALPLLSFALDALYEAYRASGRDDRRLRATDWNRLGGVSGALQQTADRLHDDLEKQDPDALRTMRRVMLRMVSVQGDLASQRAPRADLDFPDDPPGRVDDVLTRLVAARLIVANDDWVEPAHDALVRGWAKLRRWVSDMRQDLLLAARLGPVAAKYAASGDAGFLWTTDPDLPSARALAARPDNWLNRGEIRFIGASEARRRRGAHLRTAAVAVFVAGISIFGIGALFEREAALAQRDHAFMQYLAVQARRQIADRQTLPDVDLAAGYAAASIRLAHERGEPAPPDALEAAQQALRYLPVRRMRGGPLLTALANGMLASVDPGKTVAIIDPDGHGRPGPSWPYAAGVSAMAGLPDGSLATAADDGTVMLWPRDGGAPRTLRTGGGERLLAALADGRIAASGADGVLRVWDAAGREQTAMVGADVQFLVPLPGGGVAVGTGGDHGQVLLWPSGKTLAVGGEIAAMTVQDDGSVVVARDDDVLLRWNGAGPPARLTVPGGVSELSSLAGGRLLAMDRTRAALFVLPASRDAPPIPLAAGIAAFGGATPLPDGRVLVTTGARVRAFRLLATDPPGTPDLLAEAEGLIDVAHLRDDRFAVSTRDGEVVLFPAAREPLRVPDLDAKAMDRLRTDPAHGVTLLLRGRRITLARPGAPPREVVLRDPVQDGAILAGGGIALAAPGPEGTLTLLDAAGANPTTRQAGFEIASLVPLPDGGVAAIGADRGMAWDPTGAQRKLAFGTDSGAVALPDGSLVTVANELKEGTGTLLVHRPDGQVIRHAVGGPVGPITVLPDGRVATARWHPERPEPVRVWPADFQGDSLPIPAPDAVYDLAALPGGRLMVAMNVEVTLSIPDVEHGEIPGHADARAWLVDDMALVAAVCARPRRFVPTISRATTSLSGKGDMDPCPPPAGEQ